MRAPRRCTRAFGRVEESHFVVVAQGLRASARLFRPAGAGASDYLGVFIILKVSIRRLPSALPRTISWLGLARSVNWRGLSEPGMARGRDFSLRSIIFLLLCSLYICYIVRVLQPGAAPAGGAASTKSWLAGETRNGLQLCGPVAYRLGPSYRGPLGPEV